MILSRKKLNDKEEILFGLLESPGLSGKAKGSISGLIETCEALYSLLEDTTGSNVDKFWQDAITTKNGKFFANINVNFKVNKSFKTYEAAKGALLKKLNEVNEQLESDNDQPQEGANYWEETLITA